MEKAIHITKLENFKYCNFSYNRVYFGAEFCQNLIPSIAVLEKAFNFAQKKNYQFTLVTPFVTEKGLYRLNELFQFLRTKINNCEVVVNDWGVLGVLSSKYKTFKLSLGRLLTRQSRDPAMAQVLKKQPPFAMIGKDGRITVVVHVPPNERYQKGIKASYVNATSVQGFLSRFNICRIELNNLMQGLNLENLRFNVSLYTPFVNISTTRFCPMESRFQKIYRINVCKRECQKYYSILRNRTFAKYVYKRGNTIFYKNPVNPRSIDKTVIDRIVFQPELPF